MPTVSIIVPTFNRASLVAQTLRSVLAQSFEDFELIILDDGSSDNTREVVNGINDDRIRYIRHDRNIGFTANWTHGVRLARGEFLSILGDDDLYKPDYIKNRIAAFGRNPGLLAVTGGFDCIDLDGIKIRQSLSPCATDTLFSGKELIELTLGFSGEWFNGATLYRAAVVQALWDEIVFARTALDLTLHILLSLRQDACIEFLNGIDMSLRVHAGQESISNNFFLTESAAQMAMKLWHSRVKNDRQYRSLFQQRFSDDVNRYGRMLWDKARITESRAIFLQELAIDPIRPVTWLRYIRTFITKPSQ